MRAAGSVERKGKDAARPQVAFACALAVGLGASTLQRDLVVVTLSKKWQDEHQLPFAAGTKAVKGYEDVQRFLEVTSTCPQPNVMQRFMESVESWIARCRASHKPCQR